MNKLLITLLLLSLPAICAAQIAGPQPERELESFLEVLSADDLKDLQRLNDFAERKPIAERMSKLLEKTEVGKRVRLRMKCGAPGRPLLGLSLVRNQSDDDKAKKNGSTVQVHFNITARVPRGKEELVKLCREDRRVYVTGTVAEISISSGRSVLQTGNGGTMTGPIVVNLTLAIEVEDIGTDK